MTSVCTEFYGLLQKSHTEYNYSHNLINFNDNAVLQIVHTAPKCLSQPKSRCHRKVNAEVGYVRCCYVDR